MTSQKVVILVVPEGVNYDHKKTVHLKDEESKKKKIPIDVHPCETKAGIAAQWLNALFSSNGWKVHLFIVPSSSSLSRKFAYLNGELINQLRELITGHEWYIECHDRYSFSSLIDPLTLSDLQIIASKEEESVSLLTDEWRKDFSVSVHSSSSTEMDNKSYAYLARQKGIHDPHHCMVLEFNHSLSYSRLYRLCQSITFTVCKLESNQQKKKKKDTTNRGRYFKTADSIHHEEEKSRLSWVSSSSSSSPLQLVSQWATSGYYECISTSADPFRSTPSVVRINESNNQIFVYDRGEKEEDDHECYSPIDLEWSIQDAKEHTFISILPSSYCVRPDFVSNLVECMNNKKLTTTIWVDISQVRSDTLLRILLSVRHLDNRNTRAVHSEYAHALVPLSSCYSSSTKAIQTEWVDGGPSNKKPPQILNLRVYHPLNVMRNKKKESTILNNLTNNKPRNLITHSRRHELVVGYAHAVSQQIQSHLTQKSPFSLFPSGTYREWESIHHLGHTSLGLINDVVYYYINQQSSSSISCVDDFIDHLIRLTCLQFNLTTEMYLSKCNTVPGFVPSFLSHVITLIPWLLSYTSDQFSDNHSFPASGETPIGKASVDCEELGSLCCLISRFIRKATKSRLAAPLRDLLKLYTEVVCEMTATTDAKHAENDMVHVNGGLIPTHLLHQFRSSSSSSLPDPNQMILVSYHPIRLPVLLFDAVAGPSSVSASSSILPYGVSEDEGDLNIPVLLRRYYSSSVQLQKKYKYNILSVFVVDEDINKTEELIPITWNPSSQSWCWGIPTSVLWNGFIPPSTDDNIKVKIPMHYSLWAPVTMSSEFKQMAMEVSGELSRNNRIRFQPEIALSWLNDNTLDKLVAEQKQKAGSLFVRSVHVLYRERDTKKSISLKRRLKSDLSQQFKKPLSSSSSRIRLKNSSTSSFSVDAFVASDSKQYVMDGLEDVSRIVVVRPTFSSLFSPS